MERAQRAGDIRWQGNVLGNIGSVHASRGRLGEATTFLQQAHDIAVQLGDRQREGTWLSNLGMLHYLAGDCERAVASLQSALSLAQDLGFVRLACTSLANLGLACGAIGDWANSRLHNEAAVSLARQIGHRRVEAQVLGQLGLACGHLGMPQAACAALAEAEAIFREADDTEGLAILLCAMAECFWLIGDERATPARDEALALAGADAVSASAELGVAIARLNRVWQRRDQAVPAA
jgi:tetratricopeptide (TPR) repeat protein